MEAAFLSFTLVVLLPEGDEKRKRGICQSAAQPVLILLSDYSCVEQLANANPEAVRRSTEW